MEREKAFTLLELLIVIAIISILASLFFPALHRARQASQSASCLNNLKQWGIATHLFAMENNDFLPKDGAPNGISTEEGWYLDLPRALGIATYREIPWRTNATIEPGRSIWICPSNQRRSNGNNLFHYCLNEHVNKVGAGNQVKLSAIRRPTAVVWLFDNGKLAAVAQENNVHTNLHNRGAQFTFLDAHSARFKKNDYWDSSKNVGRTDNPSLVWHP
jgi:prepilin-type N-terminal cleavage/methylation domain-containing protein